MAMRDQYAARADILGRVPRPVDGSDAERLREWREINREFRSRSDISQEQRVALFEERVRDYGAGFYRATTAELREAIARVLKSRGRKKILVPVGLPESWLPTDGIEILRDERLSYEQLDKSDGALTACSIAIALTGTFVLQGGAFEGRRALTLVPDYHLCVIEASKIVEFVPEAMQHLRQSSTHPTTFVSGPSATADIEMTRVQGVHGPRVLDVIVVD
jgi:L-lactate dehydrogenase complex protein LldG